MKQMKEKEEKKNRFRPRNLLSLLNKKKIKTKKQQTKNPNKQNKTTTTKKVLLTDLFLISSLYGLTSWSYCHLTRGPH